MKRVVITGLGAITPLGHDTKETWVNILAGKSGINLIKAFDTSKHTVKIAGEIPDFQPETRVEPKSLKRLTVVFNYLSGRRLKRSKMPKLILHNMIEVVSV